MIKVENVKTWGFETAVRAMRNPLDSWYNSDSGYCNVTTKVECKDCPNWDFSFNGNVYCIGKADLDLMRRLYKAGSEHRTYSRMLMCSMDIVAPLYFWKEADRYTVGKSQVSCSTMHTIHKKEFTLDDFSHDHLDTDSTCMLRELIGFLNHQRDIYVNGIHGELKNDKQFWWNMIQLLPSSYNQRRTVCMSYEVVFKIIRERTGHKLDEWREFVGILKGLPYIAEITGEKEEKE